MAESRRNNSVRQDSNEASHDRLNLFSTIRPEFFYLLIYKPSYCNFRKVEKKKNSKIIFLFHPPTLNIICFVEKKHIYFRGSFCVFLRVTLLKVIVLSRLLGK